MYVHNAYGALQQRATYEGLFNRDSGRNRPFVLTRSYFLGSQRYSGMWTGDSQANTENVEMSVQNLLSLGVSGIVFGGCDIPGFYGTPTDDLFVQFYQLGVFYPFMRAHNNIPRDYVANVDNFSRREPWLQSERVQTAIRASIYQRYSLIHYIYTLFFYANTEGLPLIRPLWMEFQDDTATFDIGTQFMFGSNMMVAPKLGLPEQMGPALNGLYNLTVYLPPAADWYFYDSKQFINGSSTPQNMLLGDANYGTFVKAGSILPILNYELGRMSLLSAIDDNLRIEVYPTAAGSASGELYLDDGLSHDYMTGAQTMVQFNFDGTTLSVQNVLESSYYKASNKMIDEVTIFNVVDCPQAVLNKWADFTPYPDQGTVYADFTYLPDAKTLHVIGLNIPVDDGLVGQVDLLQIVPSA